MIAYQFPGQGSQFVGMGSAWAARFPEARAALAEADEVLGFALSRLCFEGPEDALNDTFNTQPALLAASVAMLRALEATSGAVPAFVAGHSLGEFSALVAAGALSFEDGLRLVRERGRLMKATGEQNPGGMSAVLGLQRDALEALCAQATAQTGRVVGVANDNCPGQIVVSGAFDALECAEMLAREQGAKRVVRLAVSIASHSTLMVEAAAEFRAALDAVPLRPPRVPVVDNATAAPITEVEDLRDALARQLTLPVRWTESVRWLAAQGVEQFIEVGPGNVLTGLLKRVDRGLRGLTAGQVLGIGEGVPQGGG